VSKTIAFIITFLCVNFYQLAYSQTNEMPGSVSGKIIDAINGESIIGANIIIEGTVLGGATDLDGYYSIRRVPPGEYTLIVSYISFQRLTIRGVIVNSGSDTKINAAIAPESIELGQDVIVMGEASNQYEGALLNQRKKSVQIIDGISAELIKRTTDSNTAETLRRVPGITLVDGKFIFVRGVSERYSGALLNNSPLASTEPDKKDFAFDLIPSSLIENTMVVKSFTPDEPGDFAGGLVKVNTVDFPAQRIFSLSYSTSYTENTSTKNFLTSQGGSTDWLGIDDGTRALPDGFPTTEELTGFTRFDDTLYTLSRLLKNTWKSVSRKAPLNRDVRITFGDRYHFLDNPFGVILSLSYKDDYNYNQLVTRDLYSEGFIFDYRGEKYSRNVHWGTLLNFAYKFNSFHKIMFKNNYTQDSDNESFFFLGDQIDRSSNVRTNALRFVSRSLYSGQVAGDSYLPILGGLTIEWRASYSQSLRDEPDYKRYYYARDLNSTDESEFRFAFPASPSLREGGRFFSKLSEFRRGYNLDLTKPISNLKFKMGIAYSNSARSFNSRLLGMLNPFNLQSFRSYAIDSLFNPENFFFGGLAVGEYINATNTYSAGDEIFSMYGMTEIPFSLLGENFLAVFGARSENYILRLRTNDPFTGFPINLDYLNPSLLPSLNLIYRMNNATNLRFSYTETVNRPQFREVAPFNYYDFQEQTNIGGNIDLKEATIANYDIRFETFPNIDELISFSLFYKEINDPIEKIILSSSSNNVRTFINASFARNWGFEAEIRSSLGNLVSFLDNFTFIGNYTRLYSELEEFQEGAPIRKRRMQGQSPYVINLSMNYTNTSIDGSISLSYYKFGERIVEIASSYNADWLEKPRDLLDLVISKNIGSHFEIKLGIKDILSQPYEIFENETLVRQINTNTKFGLGVSYRL
jgi:hypothetical protein